MAMKEVSIYIVSGIKSLRKQDGMVGCCLECYMRGSKYPETRKHFYPVENVTRNQSELISLIKALKHLNKKCILTIYTESPYVYQGFAGAYLVEKWIKSGWKTGKNVEVKNRDLWQEALKKLNGNIYTFMLNETNAYVNMLHQEIEKRERMKNV